MTAVSPIQRKFDRYMLRKRGSLAIGQAVEVVVPMLVGRPRIYAANIAKRQISCAVTQYVRIITPPNDASRIVCTNGRNCRLRTCPQCEYRRACKMRRKLVRMFDEVWQCSPHARAILVGLSTRNQPLFSHLRPMIKQHQVALDRFWKKKRITSQTLGHFTSLEMVVRGTPEAPEAGVHSHSVAFVPHTYFTNGPAIWQPEFQAMWRQAGRLSYAPIVDVRVVQAGDGSTDREAVYASAVECAKYIVSSESLFTHENGHTHVDGRVALTILAGFRNVRIHRFDRCFAEAAKRLRLSDPV